jgi:hypothetical protein
VEAEAGTAMTGTMAGIRIVCQVKELPSPLEFSPANLVQKKGCRRIHGCAVPVKYIVPVATVCIP